MTPERWQKVKAIFDSALQREPEMRAAFVSSACGGDEGLRREVESLIAAHEKDGSFIDSPAYQTALPLLKNDHGLKPGQIVGHYEILSTLGRGGMGEVDPAFDVRLKRKVALKLLPKEVTGNPDRLRRFEHEAYAASALNHPNILTIHEIGLSDGQNFITTEFIDGPTLRERMKDEDLTIDEVLDLAIQVASALSAAHEVGIIHRDIKPENIMVRRDGIVKVLDFGLAKTIRTANEDDDREVPTQRLVQTKPGIVMGTVAYMSPEQARGKSVDARSDIWSFGVVLYEMVAGRPPFTGETASDTIAAILKTDPLALKQVTPNVPDELQRIVSKSLRPDRNERYQTSKDLAVDLKTLRAEVTIAEKLKRSISSAGAGFSTPPAIEQVSVKQTVSSAEYLVGGIKHHRRALTTVLGAVIVIIGGLAYYAARHRDTSANRVANAAIDSIAVLPFENGGHDPDQEYLSDGITENIINTLSRLPGLRTLPRSTVYRFKGKLDDPGKIGEQLGVRAILTGKVVRLDNQLQIQTELIDVNTGAQIWGEHYNRPLADVFGVQETIAKEIAANLRLKLTGAEQQQLAKRYTENVEAYQLYLEGRFYWNKRTPEGIKKSIDFYQRAIEKDPGYAVAYAGLADSYVVPADVLSPEEKYPRAKAAAKRALELDWTLAEPHAALARAIYEYDWNRAEAEKEYRQSISMNPKYATAHQFYSIFLSQSDRTEEAIAEGRQAQLLDPLSLSINASLGYAYLHARKTDDALAQFRKILELDSSFADAHQGLAATYLLMGKDDLAIEETLTDMTLRSQDPNAIAALRQAYNVSGAQGFWRKQLQLLIDNSKGKYISPVLIARVYARMNDQENALLWLERGYRERAAGMLNLSLPGELDRLRSNPRFIDLVKRVGS